MGETDELNWLLVTQCIVRFNEQKLDLLGWNVLNKQLYGNGSQELPALAKTNLKGLGNLVVNSLFSGDIHPSNISIVSMLSQYGPVDWFAYLGCHLWSKQQLIRISKYSFSENIYSLVFKQLRSFADQRVRYAATLVTPIIRVSDDFDRMDLGTYSPGWMEDHRTVVGASPSFWVSILYYACRPEFDDLFMVIISSVCLSHARGKDKSIRFSVSPMLRMICVTSADVLKHWISSSSYYFEGKPINKSLRDFCIVTTFWENLFLKMEKSPTIFEPVLDILSEPILSLKDTFTLLGASEFINQGAVRGAVECLNRLAFEVSKSDFISFSDLAVRDVARQY